MKNNAISEQQMGATFKEAISSIPNIPKFQKLYREVACRQGIADFIGLEKEGPSIIPDNCSLLSGSNIMSILLEEAVTEQQLIKKTSYGLPTIRKTINAAIKESKITKNKDGKYCLSKQIIDTSNFMYWSNLWAFELKLHNWHRALFQAAQYLPFASHSIVVMPFEKKETTEAQKKTFNSLGIGLLLYDASNNNYKWVVLPKENLHPYAIFALYTTAQLQRYDRVLEKKLHFNI
jgi:hypothetical protein